MHRCRRAAESLRALPAVSSSEAAIVHPALEQYLTFSRLSEPSGEGLVDIIYAADEGARRGCLRRIVHNDIDDSLPTSTGEYFRCLRRCCCVHTLELVMTFVEVKATSHAGWTRVIDARLSTTVSWVTPWRRLMTALHA